MASSHIHDAIKRDGICQLCTFFCISPFWHAQGAPRRTALRYALHTVCGGRYLSPLGKRSLVGSCILYGLAVVCRHSMPSFLPPERGDVTKSVYLPFLRISRRANVTVIKRNETRLPNFIVGQKNLKAGCSDSGPGPRNHRRRPRAILVRFESAIGENASFEEWPILHQFYKYTGIYTGVVIRIP